MTTGDDYLRQLLGQAAAEAEFLERLDQSACEPPMAAVGPPAGQAAALSLMITRPQRVRLRELGFSDEDIRAMTPAEAHRHLAV